MVPVLYPINFFDLKRGRLPVRWSFPLGRTIKMRFETTVTIILLPLVCKPSVSIHIMVNESSSAKNMEEMGDISGRKGMSGGVLLLFLW